MTERKLLGQILKEMKLVTESQVQEALAIQKERGGAIGAIKLALLAVVYNVAAWIGAAIELDLDRHGEHRTETADHGPAAEGLSDEIMDERLFDA